VSTTQASEVPYHPYGHPPHLRCADAERESVAAMVRTAAVDGRLRLDEIDERMDAVFTARTHGELAAVIADIVPAPAPTPPAARTPVYASGPTSRVSDRTILPAFLLCFFFGIFGAHRFYAGRTGSAVAMLVLFFLTLGVVPAFWMLIDLIILGTSSFRDGQGNLMRRWI
jgi:TM2 domain-containing membrane protein YozV